jgi:hypothetical protein
MITIEGIRATGLYLLGVLKSEKAVRYSRFYNDTPGSDESLAAVVMPFVVDHESCGAEDLSEEGHVMLEFAVWQLEDLGVVQVSLLDETLIDGERDYRIELTEKGAHVLAEGLNFHFRRPEYWITATPASEWLISLLEAGGEGQELTLRDVIDSGHSDGDVAIDDDCGNTYRLGTRTYAWAFEVSLWHHARAGHIEPAFETAEQDKLWSDFVGKTGRPSPPDINAPQPLWDIPFRLADAVYAGKVQMVHVGKVGGSD